MTKSEKLLAHLGGWRGGRIWFTERLKAGSAASYAQQTFKLVRADWGERTVYVTGGWGHDLSLLDKFITRVELKERTATVTERLAPGVTRTSTFQLLALTDEPQTSIGRAAHVWFCNTGSIRSLGGTEAEWFLDNYARGASSLDPRAHARLRRQVERTEHEPVTGSSGALLKSLRRWRGQPVVFWVGGTLQEQLAFWWACHVVSSSQLEVNAWFAGPSRAGLDPDLRFGLASMPPADHARMFGDAHRLSSRAVQVFAAKWRDFCRGRVPSVSRIAHWPTSKSWALEVPSNFHAPFPRRLRRAVGLSPLDAELLTPFASRDWRNPFDVLRRNRGAWATSMSLLGDSLPARLVDWAAHENGRYLASRPAPPRGHQSGWTSAEYRLTEEGRTILRKGLGAGERAPPYRFGGFG